MMINPPNIKPRLLPHILQKRLPNRIKRIAKLKLAPKQNPPLVRELIKKVRTIRATGPNAEHVLVAIHNAVEESCHFVAGHARPEGVGRDEIGTFGVEGVAVDFEVPVVACCGSLVQLGLGDGEFVEDDRAEAGASGGG